MNILWDFDGTIVDTYPMYVQCFKKIMGEEISSDDILYRMKISYEDAKKAFSVTDEQDAKIRLLRKQAILDQVKPFIGIERVLNFAKKNVIVTHKSRQSLLDLLHFHGIAHYFIEIIAGDDGFPRKPDVTAYQYLHRKYGIDLAIGDRALDLKPARQLGIMTCSFQNQEINADIYLTSYENFFKVIEQTKFGINTVNE